jgi:hypothetical protein
MKPDREPRAGAGPQPSLTAEAADKPGWRLVEPLERISEIWFGVVMVLTFTCSLSVRDAGRTEVRDMLIDALGCNLAWGILDGFMHLVAAFVQRGRGIAALRIVHSDAGPGQAYAAIAGVLPPLFTSALAAPDFEALRQKLRGVPVPPSPRLTRKNWVSAFGIFGLVFLSTFPIAIPFMLIRDARLALRVSNGIAIVILFLTGYAFGRHASHHPWRMGLGMVLVGSVLVAITIALGG